MKDLVIELILIAMIVVPLVADSRKPCRVTNRLASGPRRTASTLSSNPLPQRAGPVLRPCSPVLGPSFPPHVSQITSPSPVSG